jgi:hypothetical protein
VTEEADSTINVVAAKQVVREPEPSERYDKRDRDKTR